MAKKYKVSEVAKLLKKTIESCKEFRQINVEGEISNLKAYHSKTKTTYFFSMKDDRANITCVSFNNHLFDKGQFKNGDKVTATGRIALYERDCRVSFMVNNIQKTGLGDLFRKYEEIKQNLRKEGLFNKDRKVPIPLYPEKVGIITAINSAACADVKRTINRRSKFRKLVFFDTTVQGESSPKSIKSSLIAAEKMNLDVIIMCRGGGSFEDLFCFSDEKVIRQMSKMKTPIVTGIGHEVDVSLADYVCDLSCSTPTAAAEAITYVEDELIAYIDRVANEMNTQIVSLTNNLYNIAIRDLKTIETGLKNKLTIVEMKTHEDLKIISNALKNRIIQMDEKIDLSYKQMYREIEIRIIRFNQLLSRNKNILNFQRFESFINNRLKKRMSFVEYFISNTFYMMTQKINHVNAKFKNSLNIINEANPNKILERGYAIIHDQNYHILSNINDVKLNQNINVKMKGGLILANVNKIKKGENR